MKSVLTIPIYSKFGLRILLASLLSTNKSYNLVTGKMSKDTKLSKIEKN